MFIYKITNVENNLCYIGFDTHLEHLEHRWKTHKRDCLTKDTKFYMALRKGPDKFRYEIIDHSDRIIDLAFKEIYWIDEYNSYKKGYNSTRGGDGIGQDLSQFTEDEINQLKQLYSFTMTDYNYNIKWKNKTNDERRELTKHLHTEEVYKKRSETLIEFYKSHPELVEKKREQMIISRNKNKEIRDEQAKLGGLLGAAKVSKKVKIEFVDGTIKIYDSKSAFSREYGCIIDRILLKTKENKTHRGFRGWEI